jgi:hypothetical protein
LTKHHADVAAAAAAWLRIHVMIYRLKHLLPDNTHRHDYFILKLPFGICYKGFGYNMGY